MLKKVIFGVLIIAAFSGCLKNSSYTSSATCNYDPCSVKAPDSEITAVQAYLSANNIVATQHCSGMFYKIDTAGTGTAPKACSTVGVRYRGYLASNGSVFDQQTSTIYFPLSNTVRGWTNGVPLIKRGGVIHLYIPPSLGYGNQDVKDQSGNVIIPKNSIIVFDVRLDDYQ